MNPLLCVIDVPLETSSSVKKAEQKQIDWYESKWFDEWLKMGRGHDRQNG